MLRASFLVCTLAFTAGSLSAQTPAAQTPAAQMTAPEPRPSSIAFEADVLAYGLPGYSGILNISLANGFQVAFGAGRYRVPSFLLSSDDNYDAVKWTATSTSIQVLRVTYRFRGPMRNGPALGVVVLNEHWRLRSDRLTGETTFRPLRVGVTGGYYLHIGKYFYLYPTAAFTRNHVYSGEASLQGIPYTVEKFGPNASLHAGWDWGWKR
jgi:hypothetical protein